MDDSRDDGIPIRRPVRRGTPNVNFYRDVWMSVAIGLSLAMVIFGGCWLLRQFVSVNGNGRVVFVRFD